MTAQITPSPQRPLYHTAEEATALRRSRYLPA